MRWFLLALSLWSTAVFGQSIPFPGPGTAHSSGATYSGPGDVVSGWQSFYSCARSYNAAYANGTNPLCDLVDKATGAVPICTLRVATSGFVDLTGAYCVGSTTPSIACAAAAGGACNVSQMYDASGNSRHALQATVGSQAALTFNSSPTGTLPVVTCATGVACFYQTSGTFTIPQPMTMSGVYRRTGNNTTLGGIIGPNAGNIIIGPGSATNTAQVNASTEQQVAATDNTWHSLQGLLSGANCAINVDGTDTAPVNCGVGVFSSNSIRLMRGGGSQVAGNGAEMGIIPATTTATQRNNISANQHGANGYNF